MIRVISLCMALLLPFSPGWAAQAQVVEIEVTGMTCPFCVYGTEKKLSALPNVEQAQVSLKHKKARIVMAPGTEADLAAIRKAITAAGFTPGEVRTVAN